MKNYFRNCLTLTGIALVAPSFSGAQTDFYSNPTPTSYRAGTELVLHKELNGFSAYGKVDHAADIVYSGGTEFWTFDIPNTVSLSNLHDAYFRMSLALDDNGDDPSLYQYEIDTNGSVIAAADTGLPHGSPRGGPFTNWVQRDYAVDVTGYNNNTVTIFNNTNDPFGSDWIGLDWIELHLPGTQATPEPGAAAPLIGTVLLGGFALQRRRATKRKRSGAL